MYNTNVNMPNNDSRLMTKETAFSTSVTEKTIVINSIVLVLDQIFCSTFELFCPFVQNLLIK